MWQGPLKSIFFFNLWFFKYNIELATHMFIFLGSTFDGFSCLLCINISNNIVKKLVDNSRSKI